MEERITCWRMFRRSLIFQAGGTMKANPGSLVLRLRASSRLISDDELIKSEKALARPGSSSLSLETENAWESGRASLDSSRTQSGGKPSNLCNLRGRHYFEMKTGEERNSGTNFAKSTAPSAHFSPRANAEYLGRRKTNQEQRRNRVCMRHLSPF